VALVVEALRSRKVLVVGGGIAGLQASLQLAALGVKVLLVEKEQALGGHANLLSKDFLTGDSIREWIGSMTKAVIKNLNIEVFTETEVTKVAREESRFRISLKQKAMVRQLETDAVVVATGFNLFDASKMPQYGYGRYKDVINNLEFEEFLDPEGLTKGEVLKPSDGKRPRSVVFLTCIGSRDVKYNSYCCRVGCPVALKQALTVKEQYGEGVAVYVCYIDMRAVGRGVEESYRKAIEAGVIFLQGQPSEVRPGEDGFLKVELFEASTGKLLSVSGDLIVLVAGLSPNVELAPVLGLEVAEDGLYAVEHPKFETSTTNTKGIFLAGTAEGPKDIAETLDHASKTALKVAEFLLLDEKSLIK
jgi:heterodisulfide reductase subunit A